MKIGEYIICKNEIKHIDRGLENLIDADVICILDTGSTDGTYERFLELEKQYPNIHVRQQTFSPFYFDVAREAALAFVREYLDNGDICLTFDLDEYVSKGFIPIIRSQIDPNADVYCVKDQSGCWHTQGHRLDADVFWCYHIHETLLGKGRENQEPRPHHWEGVSYFHNQDNTKPRNYYDFLKRLVDQGEVCVHYLSFILYEEIASARPNQEILDYYGKMMTDRILYDASDYQYGDYAVLIYGLNLLSEQYDDYVLEHLYEMQDKVHAGEFVDTRAMHIGIATRLEHKVNISDYVKEIELQYIQALKGPKPDGWLDFNYTDHDLYFRLMMFSFYHKQDKITSAYYAHKLLEINGADWTINNFQACKNALEQKESWVLLLTNNSYIDGVVTTVRTLQKTNTKYPISILVTKDVCIENINILLELGLHVFIVDKIKPNNNYNEIEIDELVSLNQPGYHSALSKFYIYNLVQFDKIVYLDSDIWILKNFDDLFDFPNGAALQDVYGTLDMFCTGLLVIEPSEDTYHQLLNYFYNLPKTEELLHDQAVLQGFFRDYGFAHPELVIPIDYNLWATYYEGKIEGRNLYDDYYYNLRDIKSYHIIDKKPGTHGKQYYIDIKPRYPCYSSVLLRYIEVINYCVKELKDKGIDSPYLKYIE